MSAVKNKASKRLAVLSAAFLLASCNGILDSGVPKHQRPVPEELVKKMSTKGMSLGAPILLRIYKQENLLEVWKQDHTNRFALLKSYEICKWSGKLGPKFKEGDRQAPEGFYHVSPSLMNPNSKYHLSFNMGFPNTYDRANDRTGTYLMIHGACSSAGCYSMTDEYVEEIYALAREAFKGGQKAFQIQAFPFRLSAENMAKNVNHPNFSFWTMLKEGSDHFEVSRKQPKVDVCEKRYVFNRTLEEGEKFNSRQECPPAKIPRSLALAFNEKQKIDQDVFAKILKKNATSPFVSPEEKPLTLTASIKARATQGPLTVYDPQAIARAEAAKALAEKEAAEAQAAKEAAETQVAKEATEVSTAENQAVIPKSDGESINPISAEILGVIPQATQPSSPQAPLSEQARPVQVVPEKANRQNPES